MAAVGAKHLVGGRDLTVEVAKAKKKRLALDMDSICSFCCFVSIIFYYYFTIYWYVYIYIYYIQILCVYTYIHIIYILYLYIRCTDIVLYITCEFSASLESNQSQLGCTSKYWKMAMAMEPKKNGIQPASQAAMEIDGCWTQCVLQIIAKPSWTWCNLRTSKEQWSS